MPADNRTAPASALAAQWPFLLVAAGVVAGLVVAWMVDWRPGAGIVGGALGLAALQRVVLPDRAVGLLQVRSRAFDVAALTTMAIGIVVSAVVVPEAPRG